MGFALPCRDLEEKLEPPPWSNLRSTTKATKKGLTGGEKEEKRTLTVHRSPPLEDSLKKHIITVTKIL